MQTDTTWLGALVRGTEAGALDVGITGLGVGRSGPGCKIGCIGGVAGGCIMGWAPGGSACAGSKRSGIIGGRATGEAGRANVKLFLSNVT